jgi:predicted RNA-binding protein with PUA-like domain
MSERRYWLFKSEPSAYSFTDLINEPGSTAEWDGVRNYTARNYLRDEIGAGDGVLFYHSGKNPVAVVGTAVVARAGYPDPTGLDPESPKFDAKSSPDNPRWFMVDIRAEGALQRPVTLEEIRGTPGLETMVLVSGLGGRLSVQPVTAEEWEIIVRLGSG